MSTTQRKTTFKREDRNSISSSSSSLSDEEPIKSPTEIQFHKNLIQAQRLTSEGAATGKFDWKLESFLRRLDELLSDLIKEGSSISNLQEYRDQIDFLRETWENRNDDEDYVDYDLIRRQHAPPKIHKSKVSPEKPDDGQEEEQEEDQVEIEEVKNALGIPNRIAKRSAPLEKEIHRKTIERFRADDRKMLFGASDSELRKRFPGISENQKDPNSILRGNEVAQDFIAEEMLSLTRSLKEHSLAAKDIIHRDISKLESSNKTAEENRNKLSIESERLQEHTQFSCRCWIWVLLGIVFITFINMVWVMKFFKKA